MVQHDARGHPNGFSVPVGGADLAEEPARVHDDGLTDRLAALGGAGSPRYHGQALFPCDADRLRNVLDGARQDDAQRMDLVDRRVGGVEPA